MYYQARMAIEMNDQGNPPTSYQERTALNTTTFEKPHVVSVIPTTDAQPVQEKSHSVNPTNSSALDKKLQMAQARLQQEDINTKAQNVGDHMETKVGNIDQVRDILFGGQMRDYDKRIKHLEERFNQENLNFRNEMFERLKSLEERVDSEIDSLTERAKLDRQERQSAAQSLEHELKTLKNDLNSRMTQVDDKFSYEIKSLRQKQHNKFQEIGMQMRQQNDNFTNFVSQEVGQLQDEKVSRNDLAAFFNELAIHLTRNYEYGESSE